MAGIQTVVSLETAKEHLKITTTDRDPFLQRVLESVTSEMEEYCRTKFVPQAIIGELHDGDGGSILFPEFVPVAGLANDLPSDLQYRETPDGPWMDLVMSVHEVYCDERLPFIELPLRVFPPGRRNIRLNYRCGFSEIPGSITRVALEMTQMMWNESKQGGDWLGRQSKSQPETGTNRCLVFRDLKPEWLRVLDRYRRIPAV